VYDIKDRNKIETDQGRGIGACSVKSEKTNKRKSNHAGKEIKNELLRKRIQIHSTMPWIKRY